jgi:hypothetical protein
MRNRVVAHLSGGLGNQMFQFMAGVSLADQLGHNLWLNFNWFKNPLFSDDKAYINKRKSEISNFKEIGNFPIDSSFTLRDGRMERIAAKGNPLFSKVFGIATEDSFKNGVWVHERGTSRLFDFFMDPKFFRKIDPLVYFSELTNPYSNWSKDIKSELGETDSIGVHVRLGDYVYLGDKVIPTETYYLMGIKKLAQSLNGNPKVYIFTDDPVGLSDKFPNLARSGKVIDPPSSISSAENLMILSSCRNFVVSNSTFSWWAARLSGCDSRKIIRPSYFYTKFPDVDTDKDLWDSTSISMHPINGKEV